MFIFLILFYFDSLLANMINNFLFTTGSLELGPLSHPWKSSSHNDLKVDYLPLEYCKLGAVVLRMILVWWQFRPAEYQSMRSAGFSLFSWPQCWTNYPRRSLSQELLLRDFVGEFPFCSQANYFQLLRSVKSLIFRYQRSEVFLFERRFALPTVKSFLFYDCLLQTRAWKLYCACYRYF